METLTFYKDSRISFRGTYLEIVLPEDILKYSFWTMSRYAHCEVCSSQSQKAFSFSRHEQRFTKCEQRSVDPRCSIPSLFSARQLLLSTEGERRGYWLPAGNWMWHAASRAVPRCTPLEVCHVCKSYLSCLLSDGRRLRSAEPAQTPCFTLENTEA